MKKRPVDRERLKEAERLGLPPLLSQILAQRPLSASVPLSTWLQGRLADFHSPFLMADMLKSAERVADAVVNREHIGLETDHDCDGQTSHAVFHWTLSRHFGHPESHIHSYIGHRLEEGYGLSSGVARRILDSTPRPSLILTADNGSSDEPRIALLKAAGIDVIVSDHHEIPMTGIPRSAYACLNPTRPDCDYPDPYIAGCMVAWLLMNAVRRCLIQRGYLPEQAPTLKDSLDFVAVGTVADCVSMAKSYQNRQVVRHGMALIWRFERPCWQVLKSQLSPTPESEDLGFKIGPLLNSDGRLSSAMQSLGFLLSKSLSEAEAWLSVLQTCNQTRKKIQAQITQQGVLKASQLLQQGRRGLCVYLEAGHAGVHGISASRIKDLFGRPTVFLAPKVTDPDVLSGSVRGIEGFHVKRALESVAEQVPGLLLSFGGHQGAGGLSLALADLSRFEQAFEMAVATQISDADLGPVLYSDAVLKGEEIGFPLLNDLTQLMPFGREFEAPLFVIQGVCRQVKAIGDGTHLSCQIQVDGHLLSAVWFACRQSTDVSLPLEAGRGYGILCSLRSEFYRDARRLKVQIHHVIGVA